MFGPEHLGGLGDLVEKLEKIEAEDEETRDKEILKVSLFSFNIGGDFSFHTFFFRSIVETVVN